MECDSSVNFSQICRLNARDEGKFAKFRRKFYSFFSLNLPIFAFLRHLFCSLAFEA
ncbi:hypothetical protein CAMRE0001_2146 [Campylobacter rectus RM3267]|uniref:Uncharacterized protein n=1 Tax=Campylobacter rectus RM3267 TaxID=553218 RepID=B9D451_CAMRE|nr:hypothetical protein CAMRE0001_2146 [Campylobacter rectus RM3267]